MFLKHFFLVLLTEIAELWSHSTENTQFNFVTVYNSENIGLPNTTNPVVFHLLPFILGLCNE